MTARRQKRANANRSFDRGRLSLAPLISFATIVSATACNAVLGINSGDPRTIDPIDGSTTPDVAVDPVDSRHDDTQIVATDSGPAVESDFRAIAATLDCSMTRDAMSALTPARVAFGTIEVFAGSRSVSTTNHNPVVAAFDAGALKWCVEHETGSADAQALGLTWAEGAESLYVVFSVDRAATGDFSSFTTQGFLPTYGRGSGAIVSVIARVSVASGVASAGTYVTAEAGNNKTAAMVPSGLTLSANGQISFSGLSDKSPYQTDKTNMTCAGTEPYPFEAVFSADLSTMISAIAAGCN